MFDIPEELKKLPGKPGVYIMHDETDMIIYVGKAISLKNRVRQYFQSSRNKGAKGYGKRTPMPELSHSSVRCALSGIYKPGSVSEVCAGGTAFFEWEL